MNPLTENALEQNLIDLPQKQGYAYVHGGNIAKMQRLTGIKELM